MLGYYKVESFSDAYDLWKVKVYNDSDEFKQEMIFYGRKAAEFYASCCSYIGYEEKVE